MTRALLTGSGGASTYHSLADKYADADGLEQAVDRMQAAAAAGRQGQGQGQGQEQRGGGALFEDLGSPGGSFTSRESAGPNSSGGGGSGGAASSGSGGGAGGQPGPGPGPALAREGSGASAASGSAARLAIRRREVPMVYNHEGYHEQREHHLRLVLAAGARLACVLALRCAVLRRPAGPCRAPLATSPY